ncbi:hypothetical protein GCM10020220_035610 [Nonomuraea rubra]|uniref:hypothetical protein n=1 Tax=Nonomuraea rubra TaxID=46180 RepID=UPI0031E92441
MRDYASTAQYVRRLYEGHASSTFQMAGIDDFNFANADVLRCRALGRTRTSGSALPP